MLNTSFNLPSLFHLNQFINLTLPSPTSTTTTSTLAEPQPLHPSHLASPLLPPFPYQSAPPSFTSYSPQFCCSALSYTTLPRRAPAPVWSPREGPPGGHRGDGGPYDGVGPRTSARGDYPLPPADPSPPASLASETLSSYCDPWGQVSTLHLLGKQNCISVFIGNV